MASAASFQSHELRYLSIPGLDMDFGFMTQAVDEGDYSPGAYDCGDETDSYGFHGQTLPEFGSLPTSMLKACQLHFLRNLAR